LTTIAISTSVALALAALLIGANERFGLFSQDRFPTTSHRLGAYASLAGLFALLAFLVSTASQAPATAEQLSSMPFWSLFTMHAILLAFLVTWWSLAGRPAPAEFVSFRRGQAGVDTMAGLALGVGGWFVTIAVALVVGLALQAMGQVGDDVRPPAAIPWMAALPVWKKCLIVLSAMTVEELFFRAWLQKRVGLVISTILFVIAHAGFGQPLMFIGITVVSLVIGIAYYRTKSLLPCIVAHGVFDAIQLFIVIPVAVQFIPE
jgi:membrane protease YdiL (CAAX protease family)